MSNWLYHGDMYRFEEPVSSYWEDSAGEAEPRAGQLKGEEQCEVAIIGGGYTGLSTAYHLCRDHQVDARVLEAGKIGWGASGRNAGFCTIGGTALGIGDMMRKYGLDETRKYYQSQVDAVRLVHDIIRHENIDTPLQGDAELEVACTPKAFEELRSYAENRMRLLGLNVDVLTREEFAEQYFDFPKLAGGTALRPSFGLHPLRYANGLAIAAEKVGATLYSHSEVIDWGNDGASHYLITKSGRLRARYVVLATNGFTPEHLNPAFRGRILPLISAMVVTEPMNDGDLAGHSWRTQATAITSYDLLNYFRLLPDRRFLWGGRGAFDGGPGGTRRNFASLTKRLHEFFPEWRHLKIDYRWHGLICLTRRLTPSIGRLDDDPSVFFGFGFHGNGINTATWTGLQIADWVGAARIGDRRRPRSMPLAVQNLSGRFPLPALRLLYVKARIEMFRFTDWLK